MTQVRVLLDRSEIDTTVNLLAAQLSQRYDDGVVLAAVLRGSIFFLADLVRSMSVEVLVDFLAITQYAPETGRVRLIKDLDIDISGRDVVIVEDIVDTGLTTAFLRSELARRLPRSVAVCTLLDRKVRRVVPVELEFVGVEVPDEYLIGFGLDHQGRYRNLRLLACADTELLAADPDVHVAALYGLARSTDKAGH